MSIAIQEAPEDSLPPLVLGWLAGKRSAHTREAYLRDISEWLRWLTGRGTSPLEATEPDTAYWARHLEARGLSGPTVARKLSAMSSWYSWLARNGHISANPARNLDRPKVNPDVSRTPGMTREQAIALLAAADGGDGTQRLRLSALTALLLFSGARASELINADVEDLTTDRGHIVLWVTRKDGMRQPLALPPPAAERLNAYLASRADVTAVPAVPGTPGGPRPRRPLLVTASGRRLIRQDVQDMYRRLALRAGLPADLARRIGTHAVRHSFATLYLDAGGNLRDLQDAMGHKDPRTTRRYDRARYSLDRSPGYLLASYLS